MSLLDSALDRIEKLIDRKIEAAAPFRATVASVSGGMATVKRLGTSTAETESRATINGAPLAVNDEVLCAPVNGKPVIVGVLRRSGHVEYGHGIRIGPQDVSTQYYNVSNAICGTFSTGAITANRLYAVPFYVGPGGFAADRIGVNVTASAAGNARLGVYAIHATSFLPDALLLDAGTVDVSTTGFKSITISQTFTANPPYYLVWLALVSDVAPTITSFANTVPIFGGLISGPFNYGSLYQSHTYAALPSPFSSSTFISSLSPALTLRKT